MILRRPAPFYGRHTYPNPVPVPCDIYQRPVYAGTYWTYCQIFALMARTESRITPPSPVIGQLRHNNTFIGMPLPTLSPEQIHRIS